MQAVKSPRWRPAEREDDVMESQKFSFFGSFSRAELHTDSIRHKAHSVTQSAQTPVYSLRGQRSSLSALRGKMNKGIKAFCHP